MLTVHTNGSLSAIKLRKISGPIACTFFKFKMDDTDYTFEIFSDRHEDKKGACEPCVVGECEDVVEFLFK